MYAIADSTALEKKNSANNSSFENIENTKSPSRNFAGKRTHINIAVTGYTNRCFLNICARTITKGSSRIALAYG